MAVRTADEPRAEASQVTFTLPDPEPGLVRVVLAQELTRPRLGPPFRRRGRSWQLRFPRLQVDRMEYSLELTHAEGRSVLAPDPTNPLRAPGPFGDKSVVEFPGYSPPEWLDDEPPAGAVATVEVGSRRLSMHALLWAAEGTEAGEPLPLLIAHDGPEYVRFSALLRFLESATSFGDLPPMRAVLLPPPGNRNATYSASAVYARMLVRDALPQLRKSVPWPDHRAPVLMGASLGALAALHVHWLNPASVGGLFLQSGSFFQQRFDRQESGFERFRRVVRFVGEVLRGREFSASIPVTITCGLQEENLLNNRAVANALRRQGYNVGFGEIRDAHNWVAWRDAFDPHLVNLLERVWG